MALHHDRKWVSDQLDEAVLTGNEGAEADMERALVVEEEALLLSGGGPYEDESGEVGTRGEELLEMGKLLVSGGLAGAISKTTTAPLARLTILYQVHGHLPESRALGGALSGPGVATALRRLVAREGLSSLWRGNGVTIVHRLPYSAANFWVYEAINERWKRVIPAQGSFAVADVTRRFVAGGLAGLAACTMAYPLDLVRTRLAAQQGTAPAYHGIGATLAAIVREEGALGLYRGLGATLLQVAPCLAINYAAYETLRSAWVRRLEPVEGREGEAPPSVAATLACGSLAGLVSSTSTFPLDLVRRRIQVQGAHGAAKVYATYTDVFRHIYARDGLRGFYSGILPEYYKVIPGVAIAFCSYELLKRALGVQTNATQR